MNYKIKNVSAKRDDDGKIFAYSIIVCSQKNPEYTTSFAFTPDMLLKKYNLRNENEIMALVGQNCSIQKTLVLS